MVGRLLKEDCMTLPPKLYKGGLEMPLVINLALVWYSCICDPQTYPQASFPKVECVTSVLKDVTAALFRLGYWVCKTDKSISVVFPILSPKRTLFFWHYSVLGRNGQKKSCKVNIVIDLEEGQCWCYSALLWVCMCVHNISLFLWDRHTHTITVLTKSVYFRT